MSVKYVEYLEATNQASYIDTGISQNSTTVEGRRYEYGMMWYNIGVVGVPAGISQNTWNQLIGLYANNGNVNTPVFSGNCGVGNLNSYEKLSASVNVKYDIIMDYKNGYAEIKQGDDIIYTSNEFVKGENNYPKCTLRIFIGKDDNTGTPQYYINGRIYYFKVYDNEELIQDLRPCLDNNNTPCMYDTVTETYYYNQGTGTFKYGKLLDALYLFANNNNATAENLGSYRLYNMKIDGDDPRDFQPVLDSNGVPCLMDKINKKYYYDKNGKGFGYEEGYTPVSYLQGDGKSYIDTNIIPTENIKIIVNGHFSQVKQYDTLFGGDGTKVQCGANSNQIYAYSGQSQHLHAYTNAVNIPHIYTLTHTQLKIDNDVLSLSSTGTIQNYSIILFGGWSKGVIEKNYLSQGKVYYFKIYQSDELVFDGIPVLDSEGTPCLYDLVTETFFYNQGTGEFSYGIEESECPKADYVEYIGNNGNVKGFNTGLCFDNTWSKIEFKMYIGDCNFDTLISAGREYFNILLNYGVGFFKCRTNGNVNPNQQIGIYESGKGMKLTECTLIYTPLNWNLNGVDYPVDVSSIDNSTDNIWIFADMYDKCKLYYYKVWDSEGNLIQHLQPSLDEEGLPCLYDTINNNYIYGNSTMDYTYGKSIGYTPIKYIETNGTQYIDTGVVPTDNTDIDMVASAVEENALYLMNGLTIDTTYKFKETNTNVEPNLTASEGAILTLGSTYISYLSESEIEQAVKNGWTIQ